MTKEIKAGDKVRVTILKGGYWQDEVKGTVIKVTDASYIVQSPSYRFWSRTARANTPRAFRKSAGNVRLIAQ